MNTRIIRRFLHDENEELSDLWEPDAPQQEVYHYSLYEVAIDLEVNMDTGGSRIVAVNGVPLVSKGNFR